MYFTMLIPIKTNLMALAKSTREPFTIDLSLHGTGSLLLEKLGHSLNQVQQLHKLQERLCSSLKGPNLRLLQTFAGVLQKKIHTHAVFKETPTNYISTERL